MPVVRTFQGSLAAPSYLGYSNTKADKVNFGMSGSH